VASFLDGQVVHSCREIVEAGLAVALVASEFVGGDAGVGGGGHTMRVAVACMGKNNRIHRAGSVAAMCVGPGADHKKRQSGLQMSDRQEVQESVRKKKYEGRKTSSAISP